MTHLASILPETSLEEAIHDVRERTLALASDLSDEQLLGPQLSIVNPLRWEIGHVAWFQEKWVLRYAARQEPLRSDADALYDSAAIPHDVRWQLPLPDRAATVTYLREVRDAALRVLEAHPADPELRYFLLLALFHEDMHTEAFTYTRQTHGWPAPPFLSTDLFPGAGPLPGDVELPASTFLLGAAPHPPGSPGSPDHSFVFDNEKWQHPVEVKRFRIARAPVTQAEYAAFVEAGGYARPELWGEEGRTWLRETGAQHPVYWRRGSCGWERRNFDRWVPLEAHRPVIHVNWHEATAYCRWAARRLPTEAEWEMAASWDPVTCRKRRFPWGDEPPLPEQSNLDWRGGGCVDVGAFPAGDSPAGCRQMIGNVWEWTSDDFAPYPGFVPDPYREYSEPWFYTHKVLRGGGWATRSRLIRSTWRNFYRPERRDVWSGFRTCAL